MIVYDKEVVIMGLIEKSFLEAEHSDGELIKGTLLIRDYSIQLTKAGKEYVTGYLSAGVDISFKVWNNSSAFSNFKSDDLRGKCAEIVGTFNIYNDTLSVIVSTVQADEGVDAMMFIPTKYNIDAYWSALQGLVKGVVSEKGMKLANAVLFENEKVAEAFKFEFAAKSHHDNVKGGLMAHTYKVVYLLKCFQGIYSELVPTEDEKDLLILGGLFHDIGKTREMHMGSYTKESVVTHRFLGVEMLDKDLIVELYNENWYYHLISIMLQHHGQYAEPCHSIVARVVNIADEADAILTLLEQKISGVGIGNTINVDGSYLDQYVGM